jgi:hypothetical protein
MSHSGSHSAFLPVPMTTIENPESQLLAQKIPATNNATRTPSSRLLACVRCQQRKVKCDKREPCSCCIKARVECTSLASLPPRRRKKRFPEAELLARLRRYEEVLRSYGADIDAINNDGREIATSNGRGKTLLSKTTVR